MPSIGPAISLPCSSRCDMLPDVALPRVAAKGRELRVIIGAL